MDEQAPEVKQTAEERVSDILFGKQEPEEPQEELEDDSQEIEASEEEAEDSETPVKEEEELYEIQVGDKVYEVPADLRDSFVMQKDYTQKTQKVAERERPPICVPAISSRRSRGSRSSATPTSSWPCGARRPARGCRSR